MTSRNMAIGLALNLAVVTPGVAQSLGGASGAGEVSVGRMIAALLFCLVLAVCAAVALRVRRDPGVLRRPNGLTGLFAEMAGRMALRASEPSRAQVLQVLRASPQTEISLIRCDQIDYLIVSTPGGARVIGVGEAGQAVRPTA